MALVVLAVIAAMAGVTYYRGGEMLRDQVDKAGLEVVTSAAENIDVRFAGVENVLLTAAESVRHAMADLGATDEDAVEKLAVALTAKVKHAGIGSIKVGLEATGKLADGTGWKAPADYDARVRPWYKEAVTAGKDRVLFSDPFADKISNKLGISVSTPIRDNAGKLLGVVVGDMDVSATNDYVKSLRIFGKGNGTLLLKSGVVLSGHRTEDILKANLTTEEKYPEELRKIARKMVAGERGYSSYVYQGDEKQMFYAPTQRGYSLGILFPVSEITAMVHALTFVLLAIAAIALFVTGGVIFLIARGLTKSIGSMENVTDRLGAGDLTVTYDGSGKDEIAHISRILNGWSRRSVKS